MIGDGFVLLVEIFKNDNYGVINYYLLNKYIFARKYRTQILLKKYLTILNLYKMKTFFTP